MKNHSDVGNVRGFIQQLLEADKVYGLSLDRISEAYSRTSTKGDVLDVFFDSHHPFQMPWLSIPVESKNIRGGPEVFDYMLDDNEPACKWYYDFFISGQSHDAIIQLKSNYDIRYAPFPTVKKRYGYLPIPAHEMRAEVVPATDLESILKQAKNIRTVPQYEYHQKVACNEVQCSEDPKYNYPHTRIIKTD